MRMVRFLYLLAAAIFAGDAHAEDGYARARERMVAEIRAMASIGPAISERVLAAIARVPRHRFVPAGQQFRAYENRPLPIGEGQTISQPYIVALMTELMRTRASDVVLEVGTGSGYQAAVLAVLVKQVYTIEIIPSLGFRAAETLEAEGFLNVSTRIGDGYQGWLAKAPFDSVVVTAAAEEIPAPLIEQLKTGGRLVIPVERRAGVQELLVVEKKEDGTSLQRSIVPVRFVPLTRGR